MIPGSANSLLLTSSGGGSYEIERSLRFNPADSAYLNRTFAAGNRTKWTWSGWVKRSGLGINRQHIFGNTTSGSGPFGSIEFDSDKLSYYDNGIGPSSTRVFLTTRQFRDTSAWYHIAVALDTTQSTDATRIKVWVNGVQETSFDALSVQAGGSGFLNDAAQHNIGSWTPANGSLKLDAYLADVHFIDGQALAPTDFGEFDDNNVWQPKKYTGVYNNPASGGTLTSLQITGNGPHGFHAIRVDGTVLINSGGTSYSDNNQWSSNIVNGQKSFDGSTSGPDVSYSGDGNPITWTPTGGITYNDKVEIYVGNINPFNYNVNGAGAVAASQNAWNTIAGGEGGVNGFHLDFADNSTVSALGTDTSGNSNNWTVNNISTNTVIAKNYTGMVTQAPTTYGDAFVLGNVTPYINTSTFVITNSAWAGMSNGATSGDIDFIPTTPIPVSSSLRVYFGAYSNAPLYSTLTITYTDASTETANFTSGSGNWMALRTATNAVGKSIQQIKVSTGAASPSLGGIVVDGSILENVSGTTTDSLVDTPTNYGSDTGAGGEVRGNYCTWNPLSKNNQALTNGNLDVTSSSSGRVNGTMAVSSGKWYFETTLVTAQQYTTIGVASTERTDMYPGLDADSYAQTLENGSSINNNSQPGYGTSLGSGDVFQVAMDLDNGKLFFGKNGTWMGSSNPATGANPVYTLPAGTYRPIARPYDGSAVISSNFGQRAFAYTAPSNYKALCTQNLDDPLVEDGSKYFATKRYDGSNLAQTISGLNFSPDLVWIKTRSGATEDHYLFDKVRGVQKWMSTNNRNDDATNANSLTSFNSDGFTVGTASGSNWNGRTFVSWNWDAGSSNTSVSIGGLDSSVYNTSRVWSNGIANPNSDFDQPKTNAFNGQRGSKLRTGGNSVLVTLNFSPALTVANTVEILGEDYATANFRYTVTVDGVTTTKDVGLGRPATFNVSGSLTQITFDNNSGGGRTYLEWIRVDGEELIDYGVTPPQVPSMASTVRANPSAGFSIVNYAGNGIQGASFAHGLNAVPEMVMTKCRDSLSDWAVFHTSLGVNYTLQMHLPGVANNWNDTFPAVDSNTLTVGNWNAVNTSNQNMLAYCFTGVEGYSKFGKWTNNNSTSGTFVYLGFKPSMILLKNSDNVENWFIIDTARSEYNGVTPVATLQPNTGNTEGSSSSFNATATVDILSNGFKIYTTNPGSGEISFGTRNYIYGAWAEHPFKTSRAR